MSIDATHLPAHLRPKPLEANNLKEEKKSIKPKRFPKRLRIWRLIFFISAVVSVLLLLIAVFTYIYFANDLTSKEAIMNRNNSGVLLVDRHNRPFFSFYQAKDPQYIPLSNIPKYIQQAVIAKEDKNFYSNPGFSVTAILRAAWEDITANQFAYGGSTITQQLVKNSLLNSNKNFLRKYQELILSIEIERKYSKNQILEMYLNSVYFGEGAFGIEDAAQTYFGKDANNLNLSESALLAGLLSAPSALDPLANNPQNAFNNEKFVLDKMAEQGYITQSQANEAIQSPIQFHPKKTDINSIAPHFALMVKDALIQKYGEEFVIRSGIKVKTSIDLDWQKYAESVVKKQVDSLALDHASNGAAVVIDPRSDQVMALVGSKDWNDPTFGKINMAMTPRQPGSSFKPIIYSEALGDKLITPATILPDAPITFPGGYTPLDYDRKFRGHVSVRMALSNSLNIPAVEVMQKVGVENGIAYAKTLGLTDFLGDPSQCGLSLILGCAEVPLFQMTQAYTVFATGGYLGNPAIVLKITDKTGRILYTAQTSQQQVMDPRVAFIISSILSDNNARAMEFGNALTISRPAAVKTGTTDDFRDALTIGYTPSLVVGVWVGNNNNSPMDNIAGSLGAAPIWKQLMDKFLSGTPKENFEPPSGLSQIWICSDQGLRLSEATSSAVDEYFLPGTEPVGYCNQPSPSPAKFGSASPSILPSPTSNPTSSPTSPSSTPTPSPSPSNPPVINSEPTASPAVLQIPLP